MEDQNIETAEQSAEEAPQESSQSEERGGANAEAAKWRTKLRETETERDSLREQLEGMRRSEVERIAGSQLQTPHDLWLAGDIAVDHFLDDNGQVDPAVVQAKAEEILADRPHWRHNKWGNIAETLGARGTQGKREPSWADALRGGR